MSTDCTTFTYIEHQQTEASLRNAINFSDQTDASLMTLISRQKYDIKILKSSKNESIEVSVHESQPPLLNCDVKLTGQSGARVKRDRV